ncbi:MAG: LLM class flavin-dependent oxidoreductase [Chloroflexota bacterium]|nr:MAG: LLM class flavin-dependent oxidoreductase [Chloroflexota bacterium]
MSGGPVARIDAGTYGVAVHELTTIEQLAAIEAADRIGVRAIWLTTGGVGPDALTLFAAAAVRTHQIVMGTGITPTFPRHPLVVVQQAHTIASLAPGRFRLGIGPSHKPGIESMFGIPFERPLQHLREYTRIARSALQVGPFDFTGERFTVKGKLSNPPGIPVMVSALRPTSFHLAGEISDGGLAWICPLPYLRDHALPALTAGAAVAGREKPPMIGHCFAAVHDDLSAVRAEGKARLGFYLRAPFYQEMFAQAGYPEAREGTVSDGIVDAIVVGGSEERVADGLRAYTAAGMDEMIVSTLVVGDDRKKSYERTMRLVASL